MGVLALLQRRRTPLALAALGVLAGLLLFASGASANAVAPEAGGSPNADGIRDLYNLVSGLAIVVFIGVEGTLIYCVLKYRARRRYAAEQIHGNTALEIAWTVGAGLVLIVIASFTFIKLGGIKNPATSSVTGLAVQESGKKLVASVDQPTPKGRSLNILVTGQQYVWRYSYDLNGNHAVDPGEPYAYEQMTVPANTTVTLDITGQDVIHSWWIPKLGGKFDAVPGYTNHTWFKAPKAGVTYPGQCAELCGRNHANMRARVRVVTPAQYLSYIATLRANLAASAIALAQQRPRENPLNQPASPGIAGPTSSK